MARRPPKETEAREVVLNGSVLKPALGIRDAGLAAVLAQQLAETLWLPPGANAQAKVDAAIAALAGIAPRGTLEGMLAVQMVATHSAAMECLRRTALPNQTFEAYDMNLKHAAKLLTLYARQLEALDRHRGKGQQKITVEHVTVNAGGQAIVGAIEGARVARDQKALAAPDEAPVIPMPLVEQDRTPTGG